MLLSNSTQVSFSLTYLTVGSAVERSVMFAFADLLLFPASGFFIFGASTFNTLTSSLRDTSLAALAFSLAHL